MATFNRPPGVIALFQRRGLGNEDQDDLRNYIRALEHVLANSDSQIIIKPRKCGMAVANQLGMSRALVQVRTAHESLSPATGEGKS